MRDSLDLTKLVSQGKKYNKMYWNALFRASIFSIMLALLILLISMSIEQQWMADQASNSAFGETQPDDGIWNFIILVFIGSLAPSMLFMRLWKVRFKRMNDAHLNMARQILFQCLPDLPRIDPKDKAKKDEQHRKTVTRNRRVWSIVSRIALFVIVMIVQSTKLTQENRLFLGLAVLALIVFSYTIYRMLQARMKHEDGVLLNRRIVSDNVPWRFWIWSGLFLVGIPLTSFLPLSHYILAVNILMFIYIFFMILGARYFGTRIQDYVKNKALAYGDYQGALDMIDSLGKWRSNQADMLIMRGYILIMAGDLEEAEGAFYESLIAVQNLHGPTIAVALLDYGVSLLNQGRFEESLPFVEASVRVMPGLSSTYDSVMDYYFEQLIEPERTLEISNAMMEFAQNSRFMNLSERTRSVRAWSSHAYALAWNGHHDEANQFMAQAFNTLPSYLKPWQAALHNRAGMISRLQDKLDEARSHFQQAAELDPSGAAGQEARQKLAELTPA